jgi:hypothetical protein
MPAVTEQEDEGRKHYNDQAAAEDDHRAGLMTQQTGLGVDPEVRQLDFRVKVVALVVRSIRSKHFSLRKEPIPEPQKIAITRERVLAQVQR